MMARGWSTRIVVRYSLLQLPALALIIIILILIQRWIHVPCWLGWGFVLLWVAKDAILFPFVWRSYDWEGSKEAGRMVGACGIAKERLAPSGYVQVGGELWQAEVMEDVRPIEKGESVKVQEIRGLILIVQKDDGKYE